LLSVLSRKQAFKKKRTDERRPRGRQAVIPMKAGIEFPSALKNLLDAAQVSYIIERACAQN
jgi:hypothetical protein